MSYKVSYRFFHRITIPQPLINLLFSNNTLLFLPLDNISYLPDGWNNNNKGPNKNKTYSWCFSFRWKISNIINIRKTESTIGPVRRLCQYSRMTNAAGLHFYWVLIFIMPLCIKKPFRSFIEIAFASWMGLKPSFIDPFSTDYGTSTICLRKVIFIIVGSQYFRIYAMHKILTFYKVLRCFSYSCINGF